MERGDSYERDLGRCLGCIFWGLVEEKVGVSAVTIKGGHPKLGLWEVY